MFKEQLYNEAEGLGISSESPFYYKKPHRENQENYNPHKLEESPTGTNKIKSIYMDEKQNQKLKDAYHKKRELLLQLRAVDKKLSEVKHA